MIFLASACAGIAAVAGVSLLGGSRLRLPFRLVRPVRARAQTWQLWLQQAGVVASPSQFAAGSAGAALVAACAVGLVTGVWVVAVVLGVMVAFGPAAYFGRRRVQRLRELQRAWPDGLRDLRASIASGRSLHQAIIALARTGPDAIRVAFARYAVLARMLDPAGALEVIKSEVADPTTDRVIEVLILAEQRGGRIVGEIVEDLAEATTRDIRVQEEIETNSLQYRLNAWAVFALPWLVLVVLIARDGAFQDFYRTSAGLAVVLAGAVLSAAGMVIVHKLGREQLEERVLVSGTSATASGRRL